MADTESVRRQLQQFTVGKVAGELDKKATAADASMKKQIQAARYAVAAALGKTEIRGTVISSISAKDKRLAEVQKQGKGLHDMGPFEHRFPVRDAKRQALLELRSLVQDESLEHTEMDEALACKASSWCGTMNQNINDASKAKVWTVYWGNEINKIVTKFSTAVGIVNTELTSSQGNLNTAKSELEGGGSAASSQLSVLVESNKDRDRDLRSKQQSTYQSAADALSALKASFAHWYNNVRNEQVHAHDKLKKTWDGANGYEKQAQNKLDTLKDLVTEGLNPLGGALVTKRENFKSMIGDENNNAKTFTNDLRGQTRQLVQGIGSAAASALESANTAHTNMQALYSSLNAFVAEAESKRATESDNIDQVYDSEMSKIDGTSDFIAGHLLSVVIPLRQALDKLDAECDAMWDNTPISVIADTNASKKIMHVKNRWTNAANSPDSGWIPKLEMHSQRLTLAADMLDTEMSAKDKEIEKIDTGVFDTTRNAAEEVNTAKVDWAKKSGKFIDDAPLSFAHVNDPLNTERQTYAGQISQDRKDLKTNLTNVKISYMSTFKDTIGPRRKKLEDTWTAYQNGARSWQSAMELNFESLAGDISQWQASTLDNLDKLQLEFTDSSRRNKARMNEYIDQVKSAVEYSQGEVNRAKERLDVDAGLTYDELMKKMKKHYQNSESSLKPDLLDTSTDIRNLNDMLKESKTKKKQLYATNAKKLGSVAARIPGLYGLHDKEQAKVDSILNAYRATPAHLLEAFRSEVRDGVTSLQDAVSSDLRNDENINEGRLAKDLQKTEMHVQNEEDSIKEVDGKISKMLSDVASNKRTFARKNEGVSALLLAGMRHLDDKILAAGKAGEPVTYDDALNAECDQLKSHLESIVRGYVSQVSDQAESKFRKAMQERQDALDGIMRGAAGNFNILKNQLRGADQDMAEVLGLVMEEQRKTEESLLKEKSDEQKNRERLDKSLSAVQKELTVDKLLVLEDETAQRDALDKRARKVKAALLKDLGEVSAHVEHEIDRLQQQANAKVVAILADEKLTGEEKRKKIEQLDAETRLALTSLHEEQVMAEERITNWAEEHNAASIEADEKLDGLEKVLKAEQLQWLKETLKEKIELRDQANSLVNVCDGLLKLIADEKETNGGKLSARRLKQLQILEGLREQLKPLLVERLEGAEEAEKIAWLVTARASGDVSEEELRSVEQELDAIGQAWRDKNGSLKERLAAAGKARIEGASHEMAFFGGTLLSIFAKVTDLMKVVEHARDVTFTRQRAVQDKVRRVQRRLMEASGVDDESFRRKLMKLRQLEIHNQQQVDQQIHDAEAEAEGMLDQEDTERALVKDIRNDTADGSVMGDKASDLVAKQTEDQIRAESKKFQDAALSDAKKAEFEARSIMKPQQEWLTKLRSDVDGIAARTVQEHGRIEGTTAQKVTLLNSNNDLVIKGSEHLEGRVAALDGQLTNLVEMVEKQQQRAVDAVDAEAAALGTVVIPPGGGSHNGTVRNTTAFVQTSEKDGSRLLEDVQDDMSTLSNEAANDAELRVQEKAMDRELAVLTAVSVPRVRPEGAVPSSLTAVLTTPLSPAQRRL